MLCQEKVSPPPNVPQISNPSPGQKTTRQRYEELHAAPGSSCGACHTRFDPIGFGFEHFDEGGRYRADESGLAIDASGNVKTASGGTLFSFNGEEELATGLANQPITYQCFAAYLATYAFGSGDACLGPSQASAMQSGTIGISAAFG